MSIDDTTALASSSVTASGSGNSSGSSSANPLTANAGVPDGVPVTAWEYILRVCPVVQQEYQPKGCAPREAPYALRAIGQLRPVNNLDWRKPEIGGKEFNKELVSTSIKNINLKAALVQLTGQSQQLEEACQGCVKGNGLWVGCVRAPASHPDILPQRACANCAMFQHHNRCKPYIPPSYDMASAFGDTLPLTGPTQMMSTAVGSWSFDPITSAVANTVLPNTRIWNVLSTSDLKYQVSVSWPLHWTSPERANGEALSMYVLDGNALGVTATEAWRRRAFVDSSQPDGIIISIGYPINNSVYSQQRNIDFVASLPGQDHQTQPSAQAGADKFLDFIEETLRPFVHSQFPDVRFTRDALYGHSLAGRLVVYALLSRPGLFDTYLAASPGTGNWNEQLISQWKERMGQSGSQSKPALRLAYGTSEAHPLKRRTETEEAYQARAKFHASFSVDKNTNEIYQHLKRSPHLRDVEMKEYPCTDHASLGAVGLTDGIDYFVNW